MRLLFAASGDCCASSLPETQPISAHQPVGSLLSGALGSATPPPAPGLWDPPPPRVHISQDYGSDIQDTQAAFIRLFPVCCPDCWPIHVDSLQPFWYLSTCLFSSSFSASSEVSPPSGSSPTLFLSWVLLMDGGRQVGRML